MNRVLFSTGLMHISCRTSDEAFNVFCHLIFWQAELISLGKRASLSESWGPPSRAAQGMEGSSVTVITHLLLRQSHRVTLICKKKSREWYNCTLLLARSPLPTLWPRQFRLTFWGVGIWGQALPATASTDVHLPLGRESLSFFGFAPMLANSFQVYFPHTCLLTNGVYVGTKILMY